MARIILSFLAFLLISMPSVVQAKRVALVIGNSAYQYTAKLANPRNDAADIGKALRMHDFEVLEGLDLDKAALDRKIRDFATALQGAQAGVFFYAGHGLQVGGQNYLVPIDAQLSTASALDFEMVRLDLVHRTMERESPTNILFLDACRDNPLARNLARAMGTRSAEIGRGLAAVESGVGTLISFSTQPGNVALDGAGRNSPFAGALTKHMASKEDLSAVLIAVRNNVMQETQGKQVPWEHSALTGRFYFGGTSPSPPATAPPPASPDRNELERAWEFIRGTDDQAQLEAFIRRFPDTPYAVMARARAEDLKNKAPPVPGQASSSDNVTPRSSVAASRFDGEWRVIYFYNAHCPTASPQLVGRWRITEGEVVGLNGDRGTVSALGEVRFKLRGESRTYAVRAQLDGSQGRGNFQIEGHRCGGIVSVQRM
jgi:uncharacterized caspase-like protein